MVLTSSPDRGRAWSRPLAGDVNHESTRTLVRAFFNDPRRGPIQGALQRFHPCASSPVCLRRAMRRSRKVELTAENSNNEW